MLVEKTSIFLLCVIVLIVYNISKCFRQKNNILPNIMS